MFATLALAVVFGAGEAASDEAFDGRWSLQVTTEQGTCRSYGDLPVRVSDGAIRHAGLGGLLGTVGRVESDGNVRFEMRQRGHVVTASGVMTEEVGGGALGLDTWLYRPLAGQSLSALTGSRIARP